MSLIHSAGIKHLLRASFLRKSHLCNRLFLLLWFQFSFPYTRTSVSLSTSAQVGSDFCNCGGENCCLCTEPLVIDRAPAQGAACCQSPGFSLDLKAFRVRAVILLFVCSRKLWNKWRSNPGQGFEKCDLADTKEKPRNQWEANLNSRAVVQL